MPTIAGSSSAAKMRFFAAEVAGIWRSDCTHDVSLQEATLVTVPKMTRIVMAQYGVRHGHAAGKLAALRNNPAVQLAGVYEPDAAARAQASASRAYRDVRWLESEDELLSFSGLHAVAIEALNAESLPQAIASARAGKQLWYDKPAGDDWPAYQRLVEAIRQNGVYLQMGYMFRYQDGFQKLADWVRSDLLGEVFSI